MAKVKKSKPAPEGAAARTGASSTLRLRGLAGAALIVLATSLAYVPALRGGFILDDDILLTNNPLIKASDGLYRFWCTTEAADYWPLANTSLWLEWRLWGMQSIGYHVTNLVLHIVNSLLIWILLQRLSIPGAFLAALLFAVHPVNVESVAWIAQRKGLLALLFVLLSIASYLKAETPPPRSRVSATPADRWYWLSLTAFVLALFSKVSVAVLPLLLLGIVGWVRPLTRRDLARIAPFLLVALVSIGVNTWFRHVTNGTPPPIRTVGVVERLLGAGGVVWFYLSKALVPINLAFLYPEWQIQVDQVWWWLPLLAVVVTTCVLWWYRRGWSRPLVFAWGFFCVALLPVMGFIDVGFMQPLVVADHYQYVALIAVMALVAAGGGTWQRRVRGPARRAANAAAVAIVSVLVVLTWQQSRLYVDSMTLYQATLDKNPDSWLAHTNLGSVLLSKPGRRQEAIGHYEQALRLRPSFAGSHYNLGIVLTRTGQPQEAIEQFQQALQLRPDYPEAHNNLGTALAETGQIPEAIVQYQEALRLKPEYPEAHYSLGNVLAQAGQVADAIEEYRQALRLNPGLAAAHNQLGVALYKTGRVREAIGHFQQALQLKPDSSDAQTNLATALAIQQQATEPDR